MPVKIWHTRPSSPNQREKEGWSQESSREMRRGKRGGGMKEKRRETETHTDTHKGIWTLKANETVKISTFRSVPEQT